MYEVFQKILSSTAVLNIDHNNENKKCFLSSKLAEINYILKYTQIEKVLFLFFGIK